MKRFTSILLISLFLSITSIPIVEASVEKPAAEKTDEGNIYQRLWKWFKKVKGPSGPR